jgi:hypothetical protein
MDKLKQAELDGDSQVAEDRTESDAIAAGSTGGSGTHPSRDLKARTHGFGIAAGYERPYRQRNPKQGKGRKGMYGTLPHAGYYGMGAGSRPFPAGQAGFADELAWYRSQYGEDTSGYSKPKK